METLIGVYLHHFSDGVLISISIFSFSFSSFSHFYFFQSGILAHFVVEEVKVVDEGILKLSQEIQIDFQLLILEVLNMVMECGLLFDDFHPN